MKNEGGGRSATWGRKGKKGVGLYEARRPRQSPSAASRHRDKELPEPQTVSKQLPKAKGELQANELETGV